MDIKQLSMELMKWGNDLHVQDIYILPTKTGSQVFTRVGQQQIIFKELKMADGEKLILHFKFVAGMDVGEKRKAQVGALTYKLDNQELRLRLSTVGNFRQRESLVIRFLHKFGYSQEYYFLPKQLEEIKAYINCNGLHLFCGPVGSGKTTLMYKLAKRTDRFQQVITIEDPVEIEEENFLQLQTNSKINLSYDVLIKACLRHRPDVLIIGEIRDSLTANAAIRAALTGHTVFATIHAKSIAGVHERLTDLGVNDRELKESLSSIIYQRLLAWQTGGEDALEGLLLAYEFSNKKQSYWINNLRKVWSYGFINSLQFEKER